MLQLPFRWLDRRMSFYLGRLEEFFFFRDVHTVDIEDASIPFGLSGFCRIPTLSSQSLLVEKFSSDNRLSAATVS